MIKIIAPAKTTDNYSMKNTSVLVIFTALTNLADGITKVALPLIATMLTTSPALAAGVSVTLTLPWLLVALHVGVLVDRSDRRILLWIANIARLLIIAVLFVSVLTQHVGLALLYAAGLI